MSASNHREQILVVDDAPDTLEMMQWNLTADERTIFLNKIRKYLLQFK